MATMRKGKAMQTERKIRPRTAGGELATYLRAPYVHMIIPNGEEGGYLAEVLELPGCLSEGETPEEAYRNLEDAKAGWIATALSTKRPIPDAVGDKEYSGHLPLRISTELHRAAALRAMQEEVSLNQWLARAIEAQVTRETMVEALADQIAARITDRMSLETVGVDVVRVRRMTVEASRASKVMPIRVQPTDTEIDTAGLPAVAELLSGSFGRTTTIEDRKE